MICSVQAEPNHPCLEGWEPISEFEQANNDPNNASKAANWYPHGLLIEPLSPKELNDQRHDLTQRWLKEATEKPINSLSLYKKRKSRADRHGRHALVPVKSSKTNPQTLQESLLHQGLARVDVGQLTSPCALHLLTLEEKARTEGRGLWAYPDYQVQKATDLHLSAKISTYQIVSGPILSLSRNPKKISYLNFGSHWKQDFTATLSAKLLKLWERQGHSLDELDGQTVYVRGWIENRDGALIRIKHPQQLHYKFEEPLSEAQ